MGAKGTKLLRRSNGEPEKEHNLNAFVRYNDIEGIKQEDVNPGDAKLEFLQVENSASIKVEPNEKAIGLAQRKKCTWTLLSIVFLVGICTVALSFVALSGIWGQMEKFARANEGILTGSSANNFEVETISFPLLSLLPISMYHAINHVILPNSNGSYHDVPVIGVGRITLKLSEDSDKIVRTKLNLVGGEELIFGEDFCKLQNTTDVITTINWGSIEGLDAVAMLFEKLFDIKEGAESAHAMLLRVKRLRDIPSQKMLDIMPPYRPIRPSPPIMFWGAEHGVGNDAYHLSMPLPIFREAKQGDAAVPEIQAKPAISRKISQLEPLPFSFTDRMEPATSDEMSIAVVEPPSAKSDTIATQNLPIESETNKKIITPSSPHKITAMPTLPVYHLPQSGLIRPSYPVEPIANASDTTPPQTTAVLEQIADVISLLTNDTLPVSKEAVASLFKHLQYIAKDLQKAGRESAAEYQLISHELANVIGKDKTSEILEKIKRLTSYVTFYKAYKVYTAIVIAAESKNPYRIAQTIRSFISAVHIEDIQVVFNELVKNKEETQIVSELKDFTEEDMIKFETKLKDVYTEIVIDLLKIDSELTRKYNHFGKAKGDIDLAYASMH